MKTLYVTINWSVSPGFENNYSRVLVSISDITEIKLAEKSLKESETNLELPLKMHLWE